METDDIQWPWAPLRLHVFDVGHGDSLLIEFPDATSIAIVDCNRSGDRTPKALSFILGLQEELTYHGKRPVVEFLCVTHPHLDHYNGFGELINGLVDARIPVRRVWDFGSSQRTAAALLHMARDPEQWEEYDEFTRMLHARSRLLKRYRYARTILQATPEIAFRSECGVNIEVLAPSEEHTNMYSSYLMLQNQQERAEFLRAKPYAADPNLISSALMIRYGAFRLILGGDLINVGWQHVLRNAMSVDPWCHAIKVSHHGSRDGAFPSRAALWSSITLEEAQLHALISGGYRSGSPHRDTLLSLQQYGAKVYVTGAAQAADRRYVPPSESATQFVESLYQAGIREVEERISVGCGDILLEGYPDGSCEVSLQY